MLLTLALYFQGFANKPASRKAILKAKIEKKPDFSASKLITRSSISELLTNTSLSKNISQESLANECEIDYSQVNRMELGKVNFSISYLYRIAKALEIDPKKLLP